MSTEYPWSDTVHVAVEAPRPVLLKLRVPGWATNASVRVQRGAPQRAAASRYFSVDCPSGRTDVTLLLNPEV